MSVYMWLCDVDRQEGLGKGFGVGICLRKILRVIEVSLNKNKVCAENAWNDED